MIAEVLLLCMGSLFIKFPNSTHHRLIAFNFIYCVVELCFLVFIVGRNTIN